METKKIAVIGLGYVGIFWDRLFSTKYTTIGFDMNAGCVSELMPRHDFILEVLDALLQEALKTYGLLSDVKSILDQNIIGGRL